MAKVIKAAKATKSRTNRKKARPDYIAWLAGRSGKWWLVVAICMLFVVSGLYYMNKTRATPAAPIKAEVEAGVAVGTATVGSDASASGGSFVRFGAPVAPVNPYACPSPYPVLRLDSTGTCVKRLQWYLNQFLGAGTVSEDGDFGPMTELKVKAYQTSKGLVADGIVGAATWNAVEPGAVVEQPSANPYACPEPYPILRQDMISQCAQRLQWYLNQVFGVGTLTEDGHFGPMTHDKVKEYQTSKGLTADGIVGSATWTALEPGAVVTTGAATQPGTAGGVSGYAFPVEPQRRSQNGKVSAMSPVPCLSYTTCHRGTAAFDLGRLPGSDSSAGAGIYAISDGYIYNLKLYKGITGCYAFQLKSSKDGFHYWHGHLGGVLVNNGQTVKVGQKVTTVGRRACTGNGSSPHLHIDRGCIVNGVKQPGGNTTCRDWGLMPLMNNIFNGLPN